MKKKLFAGILALAVCAGMVFAQASNRPARITCSKCGQSYTRAEGHTCRESPSTRPNMRPETPGPHKRTPSEKPRSPVNTRR